jgi:hypothetical protein
MDAISPEILQFLTSFGVSGALMLWLWDVRAQLRDEKSAHERTRQDLTECLRDCARREVDTRRIPPIPEEEKAAWRAKYLQE